MKYILVLLIFLAFSKNLALAESENMIEDYLRQKINLVAHENCSMNFYYEKLEKNAVIEEINLLSKNLNRCLLFIKLSKNGESFSKNLTVTTEEICSYPVFSRKIEKNAKITPEDVEFIEHKYTKDQDVVTNPVFLYNMSVRRSLAPGRLISNMDVIKPIIIKKDQKVNVVYNKNSITIKITAIALENGAIGDVIKAKNEKTGFIINCIIQEDGILLFRN